MLARWNGADHAAGGLGDREGALKRRQRHADARQKVGAHAGDIQVEVAHLTRGEILGQGAGAKVARVDERRAPVDGDQALELDGQHVAWFGAAHADRTDDGVRAAPGVLAPQARDVVDREARLQPIEKVRPRVGVDDHVARVDLEHVVQRGIEDAQAHGLGRRGQRVHAPVAACTRSATAAARHAQLTGEWPEQTQQTDSAEQPRPRFASHPTRPVERLEVEVARMAQSIRAQTVRRLGHVTTEPQRPRRNRLTTAEHRNTNDTWDRVDVGERERRG